MTIVVVIDFLVDFVAAARPSDGKLQLSFCSAINKDQGSALNLWSNMVMSGPAPLDRHRSPGLLDCQRAKCRQVARASLGFRDCEF